MKNNLFNKACIAVNAIILMAITALIIHQTFERDIVAVGWLTFIGILVIMNLFMILTNPTDLDK